MRPVLLLTTVILLAGILAALSGPLCEVEKGAIRIYQRFGSGWMVGFATCRFTPTCSRYALQVLEQDGFWTGNGRVAWRLVQCSPIGALVSVVAG